MSRPMPLGTPQRSAPVMLPPASAGGMSMHARAQSQHTPQHGAYPHYGGAGGVLASMRAQAAMPMPPRTPQHMHSSAGFTSAYAQHGAVAPSPTAAAHAPAPAYPYPMHTPLKSSASTPSLVSHAPVTPMAAPPTPAAPHSAAPSPAAGGGVAALSEAEAAKLMTALQHFVVVALQQKTAAATAAASDRRGSMGGGAGAVEVKNYATLLAQLGAHHSDPLALSRWFLALSKCVASVHPLHHSALLQLLYSFDYATAASVRNVDAFVQLLVALCVGGNVQALAQVLRTMVKSFIATNVPMATLSAASVSPALYGRPGDTGALPFMSLGDPAAATLAPPTYASTAAGTGAEPPCMDTIHDLIHAALTRLLVLLPSSPSVLFPLLVELFPHKRLDSATQLVYVKNLLRVSEYAPSLRDRILQTICERMMHMDVEIVHDKDEGEEELEEEDEDEDDAASAGSRAGDDEHGQELMFAMGDAGLTPAKKPTIIVTPAKPARVKPLSESRQMANKLDALMCLMFEYLLLIRNASSGSGNGNKGSQHQTTSGSLIANASGNGTTPGGSNGASSAANASSLGSVGDLCDDVFSSLLRVFERSVLRTHQSRFLQFLLFAYCSFRHLYAETFLRYLMERAFDVGVSGVERTSAAGYIASFVARASFLRHASAVSAFEVILKWTHAYTQYHMDTTQAALAQAASNAYSRHAPASSTAAMQVPEVGPLEASQHAVFYRLTEAVLYIFCYRQSSFLSMRESDPDVLSRLQFDKLVHSPLNPLRFISNAVVEEFQRVNEELGHIVHVEQIVARNTRLNQASRVGHMGGGGSSGHASKHARSGSNGVPSGGGIGGADSSVSSSVTFNPNDVFFPFDPYQLKHSSKYIDGIYISYRGEEDSEEEEDSSDSDSDEESSDGEEEEVRSRMEEAEAEEAKRGAAGRFRPAKASVARPIRIGSGPGSVSASSSRAIESRKRKLRLGTSTSSPPLAASMASSPEIEGMSSMSASFSEQLSLSKAASPAIHGARPEGIAMSFEMEAGAAFPKLPPAAATAAAGRISMPGAVASQPRPIGKPAKASSSRYSAAVSGVAYSPEIVGSLRMDEHKTNGSGLGSRKARKQTHVRSVDASSASSDSEEEDEGAAAAEEGFDLSADLSFSDSPLLNPLNPRQQLA